MSYRNVTHTHIHIYIYQWRPSNPPGWETPTSNRCNFYCRNSGACRSSNAEYIRVRFRPAYSLQHPPCVPKWTEQVRHLHGQAENADRRKPTWRLRESVGNSWSWYCPCRRYWYCLDGWIWFNNELMHDFHPQCLIYFNQEQNVWQASMIFRLYLVEVWRNDFGDYPYATLRKRRCIRLTLSPNL